MVTAGLRNEYEAISEHGSEPEDRFVAALAAVAALTSWIGSNGRPILASAAGDGIIRRWDATTGTPIGNPLTGHTDRVMALTTRASPDGRILLASASLDGTVRRWDATTGDPIGDPLTAHDGPVWALTSWASPDGRPMLASGGFDGTVHRWDATTGTPIGNPLTGHTDRVLALIVWDGPDGRPLLASGSDDTTIRRWDATTGTPIGNPLTGHTNIVRALTTWTDPDGRRTLASAGWDGTIRRWDAATGAPIGNPQNAHTSTVWALTTWTGPDGQPILASASASAGGTGTVHRWDAITGDPIGDPLTGHTGAVLALTTWADPDGRPLLASAGFGGAVHRWDATTGTPIGNPLTGHTGAVWALTTCAGPDGRPMIASGGDDGTIRRWDATTGTPIGNPLTGHTGWLLTLTSWTSPDGRSMLASGSGDGTVRRWDGTTGTPIGNPLTGHTNAVFAATSWAGLDGRPMLAFGADAIRRWDATTGTPIGNPLTGHTGAVHALTTWTNPDGHPILASASNDATIRRWDATTGTPIGNPLTGHTGPVRALTSWTGPDSRPILASAGEDGAIYRWDATTGTAIGNPLTGHTGAVHALTSWTNLDGRPMLVSGAADGTLRLLDATTGRLLRRVFVAPIQLRGLSDRPAQRDLLGRDVLVKILADLLTGGTTSTATEVGPTVISVEGPWGAGKTSVMRLVQSAISTSPRPRPTITPLSVIEARRLLREGTANSRSRLGSATLQEPVPPRRGVVCAWFNPWTSQSGEQVWAGVARAITDAAAPALYPDDDEHHRYWFIRNLTRLDRHALRRRLWWRTLSPVFTFSTLIALAPVLVTATNLDQHTIVQTGAFRLTPGTLALTVLITVVAIAAAHTAVRLRGRAAALLPPHVVQGPVLTAALTESATGAEEGLRDSLYHAKAGYLRLIQGDIATTVADLHAAGYDLVVFIDDLDRCSARTTSEVFEAINLFLSGAHDLRAKFVLGLDPGVVAAHLDVVYRDLRSPQMVQHGDDPSPGWAFLRKVVQLPVPLPRISNEAIDRFVADAVALSGTALLHEEAGTGPTASTSTLDDLPALTDPTGPSASTTTTNPARKPQAKPRRSRKGPVEQQPEVLTLITQRLAAQPERSTREAKRLLNTWQFYQRLFDQLAPLRDDEAQVQRACHLVILAEITTRWPALQRRLHHHIDGQSVLHHLAIAVDDDTAWGRALYLAGYDPDLHQAALTNLRALLRTYDGTAVAHLTALVL